MAFPTQTTGTLVSISSFDVFLPPLNFLTTVWAENTSNNLNPTIKNNPYVTLVLTPGREGTVISEQNLKKQVSYPGFAFETVWAIQENISYPFLLPQGAEINDASLTSRKVYVFVKEDPTGSLFHNGKVYKSLRQSQTFASVVGVDGAFITHYYGGDMLEDSESNRFNFLFSGVQDPARPGGYGLITEDTSRRVAFRTDRSNNVVFYYGMLPPLAYDAMAHVSTPTGVMDLAFFLTEKSSIRMVTSSGNIMTAGITLPNASDATKLRVMTASGIRAFQDALKTVGTGEPTQGEIDLTNEQGSDYEAPRPTVKIAPTHMLNVTASSSFGAGYEPYLVYDGVVSGSSIWYAVGTDASLVTELNSSMIVNVVRITCTDGRAKGFSVEGSNDNATWTSLGAYTRAPDTSWQEISIANTTAYRFYRLSFSGALYSGSNVGVTELELLGFE